MSASLLEMVMAISIAGLIFAGAILPVTETVRAYQESEASRQDSNAQHLAALRVHRITSSIWRDSDAPNDYGQLIKATSSQLGVGVWEITEKKQKLMQARGGKKPVVLAQPVKKFMLSYCLDDGSWVSTIKAGQYDRVVALRYQWSNGQSIYSGVAVPTDKLFTGRSITVPEAKNGQVYRPVEHKKKHSFDVKPWK